MVMLRKWRTGAEGFSDRLNWASIISPGVVVGKDGSLIGGFYYAPLDAATYTDDQRNAIAGRINDKLQSLGSGWTVYVNAIRFPASDYPDPDRMRFPDPVSLAIDQERRAQYMAHGAHYDTDYAIVVEYLPPVVVKTKPQGNDDHRGGHTPHPRPTACCRTSASSWKTSWPASPTWPACTP